MHEALVIPNDLATCQTLIEQLAATIALQEQKLATQEQKLADQQLVINELMQRAFLKRRERYLEDPNQLKLDFGSTPEAADAADGLADAVAAMDEIVVPEHTRHRRGPRKARNEQFPPHWERYEVTAEVPDDAKTCPTHGEKKVIGYDRTESMEIEPPKVRVRVTLIPKLVCVEGPECGVTEGTRPLGLVEGNRYDTSVAAEIITGKYGYHLPIYRQQDMFARSGWTPSRGTLLNILAAAGRVVSPLISYFRQEVIGSGLVGTDDTPVTLLLPPPEGIPQPREGDPKSQRIFEVFSEARANGEPSVPARMWVYRSVTVPLNVFDFTVSRHRDGPDQFLVHSGFTGTLLGDCYTGYQGIALRSDSRVVHAACNAHARRKVFDALGNHAVLASQLLAYYQQLYDIEGRGCELSAEDRQTLREQEAQPVWTRMRELLDSEAASRTLPKQKITVALGYLRNHWDALRVYLQDGRLPFDNNVVEQLMKQVAIGRKNWLFIGSVTAGERAADFLTLVSSALRNDLDVWAYIKAVLDALLAGSKDYASLRPDRWAASHPEAIRKYRQAERRDRMSAKTIRRQLRRQLAAGSDALATTD